MKTSSIVAAAVLVVVSLNHAMAGGWVVSARPNVVPLTRMVGVPINRAPTSFGPANRFDQFNRFRFVNRSAPFGQIAFQRSLGEFGFQRPFGEFGRFRGSDFRRRFDEAAVLPLGYAALSPPPPSADGEPTAPSIIWAPSYVTVVAAGPGCDYGDARLTGGPKIIVIGAPPRPAHAEKLPTVIYGAHGGCAD
jgi:hypothetical protein